MLYYFKDDKGTLRCVAGALDISDQVRARHAIELESNIRVKSAVLCLVVDNPPVDEPLLA